MTVVTNSAITRDPYRVKVTGLTDGTTSYDVSPDAIDHCLQITVYDDNPAIAEPAAGTLVINGRMPGCPDHEQVVASIDVTDRTNWIQKITGIPMDSIELVVASLTANYTLDIVVMGWSK